MVDVKNMAVIAEGNESHLGNLVWYTIAELLIPRDELRQLLLNSGLDEGFMPPEIRMPDAFRRATIAVERKRELGNEGVVENYLIKEVSSDTKHILRFIVKETKDGKGKRLDYQPDIARLELDKTTGQMTFTAAPSSIEAEMCLEAERLFSTFKTHHDSRSVRSMIYGILNSMAPTPVRPSGGVYFIPASYEEQLKNLVRFIQSLGGSSEGFMVPVINNQDNKDMVRKKLNDHIKQTLTNLAEGLKDPKLGKSRGNPLLDEAKRVLEDFKVYQATLNDELGDMGLTIDLVKQQMLTMVERLSN
jgi:hypothetical protein